MGYPFQILKNEEVNNKIIRLREVEKQAVNARELGLENAYFMYKKEYDEILSSFENDVLILDGICPSDEQDNLELLNRCEFYPEEKELSINRKL